MIFGESKPEVEQEEIGGSRDVAIFPLATPSIASPGAMMAVVLLTQNEVNSIQDQFITSLLMLAVIAAAYGLMLGAGWISRMIGNGGASIVSRVMGLILASVAATQVLEGIKEYFG
jgi:multiple antibiotic resistance protein